MPDTPSLDIACLCADWCGTCREYAGVFEALQRMLPAHRYRWIDIEDEADALGDIDIETFPTLLVAHAGRVLFAGPVLPRLPDAQRLIEVQVVVARRQAWPAASRLGLPPDQQAAYTQLAQTLHTAR